MASVSNHSRLRSEVRKILFRQWDPIGVNANPSCHDEYHTYADTICHWLAEGADEYRIMDYLRQVQTIYMGLSQTDEERDRDVCRTLLALLPKIAD